MSTVRLTKDHPRGKKGDVVSVPFGVGQEMVAAGVAQYPAPAAADKPAANAAASVAAERHAAEITRLNALHASALRDVREEAAAQLQKLEKEHAAEIARLQADLDAAGKTITELQAKAPKK